MLMAQVLQSIPSTFHCTFSIVQNYQTYLSACFEKRNTITTVLQRLYDVGQAYGLASYFCIMEWTYTLENIDDVAMRFWQMAGDKKIFAFNGQMGAGKTTFIHALCERKGVTSTISSPTFSIINDYECGQETVYHMDLYRLKDETEAQRAGVEDALYSGNICLVEWPEKAPGIFPDGTVYVSIELVDEKTRRMTITGI